MTRQVLNTGLSLHEGVFDKFMRLDLQRVIDRSDANFLEVFQRKISAISKPKVACIGSSYTQHQVSVSGASLSGQSRSWMNFWNAFTSNSLNSDVFLDSADPLGRSFSGANFGVSGESSTLILARIPDVIAASPNVCVLQSGSNNVSSVSTAISDIQASIIQLLSAGILPVYLSISFRDTGNGSSGWTATALQQASYINAVIRQWMGVNGFGLFVSANKYLCDVDDAAGDPYSGAVDTDGIHYTTWSAFQIARVLNEVVSPILSLGAVDITGNADAYNSTNNIYGNVWVNPLVSTSSNIGTTNGSVGTGVTAGTGSAATSVGRNMVVERNSGSGTAVANIATRGAGLGNWQTAVFTPSGSGTSVFYIRHGSADITHGFAVGTWVRFGCSVDVSTFGTDALYSGFQNIALRTDHRSSGASIATASALNQYSAISLPNTAWTGVLETPPFQVPAGADRIRPRLEVIIDDAKANTGTLKVGGFYLRPCPDPTATW